MKLGTHDVGLRDAFVAVAFVALFLVGLGRPELMDPDESRHAAIAQAMLARRQFLTPELCGEAYYDKPVGYHWTVAASLAAFGHTTAAVRLPSALAALATLTTTAWWARRIRGPEASVLAVAMLGTGLLFVALGRFGGLDMMFTALLTAAVARLSVAAGEAATRRGVLGSYALIALATLVKGPIALVLTLPPFVAAWLATREEEPAWLTPWRGVATILAIAGPWYVAAAVAEPIYIRTFLETHNLTRFAGSETLPHQQPISYYAIALPLALLPWTPLIAVGVYERTRGARWSAAERVLATWIVAALGVFAIAGTRLVTYLLPAFPALAVLGAIGLIDRWGASYADERATAPLRWWALLWGAAISLATTAAVALRIASGNIGFASASIATLVLVAVATYVVALKRSARPVSSRVALWVLASSSAIAAAGAYGPVADLLTTAKGYRALGAEMARELPPDSVVLSLWRAPHALSFYSGRTIGRLHDLDGARSALESDRVVLLLAKRQYADELASDPQVKAEVVWRNAQGTTLLANANAAAAWRRREGVEPSVDHDSRHHGFEDRSGHRTRSLSSSRDLSDGDHP